MILLPLAIAMLLAASAMLAASETALFALVRMEHARAHLSAPVRRAVERLLERPLEALVMIIWMNEAANVFAECLTTAALIFMLGKLGAYLSVPLMLVTVLIFCDITPKTFALGFPGLVATIMARPLVGAARVFHPIARFAARGVPALRPQPISEAEFKALLRVGEVQGEVEPQERELIHRVFDFGTRRVSEVMTPSEKMYAIDIASDAERLVAEVLAGHFSRVPIYREKPDNIIGILHVKDLVTRRLDAGYPRIERLVRPAYYVPPAMPLGELFDEMRRGRIQLAIVVNEYGKVLGLISLEDLLEELFGEIQDEFDYEGPELTQVGDEEWLVSGAIGVDRLRESLGGSRSIGSRGTHSLSSDVLRMLGRVPRSGERFRLGDYEATAERVKGATVELVRLRPWT